MPLKDDLQKLIQGETLDDGETLLKYSKDASIFEIKPKIIVYPKDCQDIKSTVKFDSQNNLSIRY